MVKVDGLQGVSFRQWKLKEEIGRGADGIVYSASEGETALAVKLYFPEALRKNGWSAARERLDLQLSLAGDKKHANLVRVIAAGEAEEYESLFVAMEHVPGVSLDKLIGRLPRKVIPSLAAQLAEAARFLESLELVHRDIKPANVIISDDYSHLTLLDLGIIHRSIDDGEEDDLSGDEFVATVRYSPPEFVWREEARNEEGAWRAVTFYQIGATLYDMIEGDVLFKGQDAPRVRLYDAVRHLTPTIGTADVPVWLARTVEACLLKDWRQRLQLVNWNSFSEPSEEDGSLLVERRIRLRQLRNIEIRRAPHPALQVEQKITREQSLWGLQQKLEVEIRTYLMDTDIFPKAQVTAQALSAREYIIRVSFDADEDCGFPSGVCFTVTLSVDPQIEEATRLEFFADLPNASPKSAWTEMFSVESSFNLCRQSFLDAVEIMLA